jgi:glycosyltransferase involved in cell wall biosynthesis
MAAPGTRTTIIIPVRNRRDLLARTLDALDAQRCRDFEVVVIDDGSSDGAGDLAAGRTVAGRPVRVLANQGRGAVAARTTGIAATTSPVLAFTDSDCEPDPGWLEAGLAALDAGADMVHGRTIPARRVWPLERSVGQEDDGLFATCNAFYRRDAFDAAGGFDLGAAGRLGFRHDENVKGMGFGEDTLLGWRLVRAGKTVVYERGAVVIHHVFPPDFRDQLSRAWSLGAFATLVREVPELRQTLVHHRVLFGPRDRRPVYATALALATRRPLPVVAAGAWWAYTRGREIRPAPVFTRSQKPVVLAQEMLIDAVTAVSLVAGSIRARSVLL